MDPPYSAKNICKATFLTTLGAGRTALKILRLLTKLSKPDDGYRQWLRRRDGAVEVKCILRRKWRTEETLGEFSMHLDAPCDICREFVKRNFREKLNQSVGDSFCIIYNDEMGEHKLPRDREYRTYSKKVIPFIIDPKSLLGTHVLTIAEDDDSEIKPIPAYEDDDLFENVDDGVPLHRPSNVDQALFDAADASSSFVKR